MADPDQKFMDSEPTAEAADTSPDVAGADIDASLAEDLSAELQTPSNDESIGITAEADILADDAGQMPCSDAIPTPELTSAPEENQPESPHSTGSRASKAPAQPQNDAYDRFPDSLIPRTRDINELLKSKETLALSYIYGDLPKAFYLRWKHEANDIFSLRVRLKNRRRAS